MTRLQLLCTGTPAPLAHRGGSSYLVQTGDETLIFDCGPASVRRMLEAGLALPSIDYLFLTHLHYDHCIDFAYLVLTRWDQSVGQIPELQVYGPAPTAHMSHRLFSADGAFGPDLAARTLHPGSHFVYEARGGVMPRERPQSTGARGRIRRSDRDRQLAGRCGRGGTRAAPAYLSGISFDYT